MVDVPYLRPAKRAIIVRMILSRIERRIDDARGIKQVRFFPWITISPGNLPNGIFIFDTRYAMPAINIKMTPMISNILAKDGTMVRLSFNLH